MQPVDDGGVQSPPRMNEEFNLQLRHQRATNQHIFVLRKRRTLEDDLPTKMGSSSAGGSGLHCAGGGRGDSD
ncbi:hypothetical protein BDA96_08G056300 [Sorghum bicolor]|uniref:Uncharacterized protein n=1 Tax=Sorghum bicolor TaxID=4558 RepID=A0A921QFT2_SORBI|nr:hypothetical protein BDA96_08G056300 [Sorghum bicolor]